MPSVGGVAFCRDHGLEGGEARHRARDALGWALEGLFVRDMVRLGAQDPQGLRGLQAGEDRASCGIRSRLEVLDAARRLSLCHDHARSRDADSLIVEREYLESQTRRCVDVRELDGKARRGHTLWSLDVKRPRLQQESRGERGLEVVIARRHVRENVHPIAGGDDPPLELLIVPLERDREGAPALKLGEDEGDAGTPDGLLAAQDAPAYRLSRVPGGRDRRPLVGRAPLAHGCHAVCAGADLEGTGARHRNACLRGARGDAGGAPARIAEERRDLDPPVLERGRMHHWQGRLGGSSGGRGFRQKSQDQHGMDHCPSLRGSSIT